MIVSGKILPGHIAHIDTDIPGGDERTPIAAPDSFLALIEDRFDAVIFSLGQFGEQRHQFIDGWQAPGIAISKVYLSDKK